MESERDLNLIGKDLDDELKLHVLIYLGIFSVDCVGFNLIIFLFLVEKHFKTFDATHLTPIPAELVTIPWLIR